MDFTKVEKNLKEIGEREAVIRRSLTDPQSNVLQRKETVENLQKLTILILGYCMAIGDMTNVERAAYYKEFYDQARSKEGLVKKPDMESWAKFFAENFDPTRNDPEQNE